MSWGGGQVDTPHVSSARRMVARAARMGAKPDKAKQQVALTTGTGKWFDELEVQQLAWLFAHGGLPGCLHMAACLTVCTWRLA